MGRTGPKPAPTAVKIAKGTHKSRINSSEPAVAIVVPEKPDYVAADRQASQFWDREAPRMVARGFLGETDGPALALLSMTYGLWRGNVGDVKVATLYRRLLAEFGMTPSSRSAIKVDAKPRDELGDFLKRIV